MNDTAEKLVNRLEEKFSAIDQNYETHLEGLVWAKPITYSLIWYLTFLI